MSSAKKNKTKERLFEAAVKLFSQKGYHGTSVRDIVREVGIKESSLYNHFPGKGAILKAIMEHQHRSFERSVDAMMAMKKEIDAYDDPVEFWMAGAAAFLSVRSDLDEPIARILHNEMYLNQECRDYCLNTMYPSQKELTASIFEVMHGKGMIDLCDFRLQAEIYIHMLQGLEVENKLRLQGGESPEAIQNTTLNQISAFIAGLRRRG